MMKEDGGGTMNEPGVVVVVLDDAEDDDGTRRRNGLSRCEYRYPPGYYQVRGNLERGRSGDVNLEVVERCSSTTSMTR
jgi:hypothetical protein